MSAPSTQPPLTTAEWLYWQRLVSVEHDRQAAEIERLRTENAKMLRALEAIGDAYLGLEEINRG